MNKAAIIIPFRDSFKNNERYEELEILTKKIEELCSKHNQPYKIFIIHQKDEQLFNKAYLLNIGAAVAIQDFDYFIFHDVDQFPISEDNIYGPRDISGCLVHQQDSQIFDMESSTYFGGVIYIKKEDYLSINGFCNYFWGWGWEDSAIRERLHVAKIPYKRMEGNFQQHYHETKHRFSGNINFINNAIIYYVVNDVTSDGYNNLKYEILNIENKSDNLDWYDVKIESPQYDITKILTKDEIIRLSGHSYNEDRIKEIINIYSKKD